MVASIHIRTILLAVSALLAGSVITDWFQSRNSAALYEQYALAKMNEERQTNSPRRSRVAKIMMLYGNPTPVYERALRGHERHNEFHGYPMFVLREKTLSEFWSKPAYILNVLLAELAKPKEERLEWVV